MQYHESFDDLRVMVQHEGSTVARSMDVHEIVRVLTAKDNEIEKLNDLRNWWASRAHEFEDIMEKQDAEIEKLREGE